MKKTIGERLVTIRKQQNMTQNDLATLLQVSYQAVSRWERNENLPDVYTLQKIAKIYGVSIDEIINESNTTSSDKSIPMYLNIIVVIGISLIMISPIPYLTRGLTDEIGGILGSTMSVIVGLGTVLFVLLERKKYR